jgi:hypothetical protein
MSSPRFSCQTFGDKSVTAVRITERKQGLHFGYKRSSLQGSSKDKKKKVNLSLQTGRVRPGRRWVNNINIDLGEIGWGRCGLD